MEKNHEGTHNPHPELFPDILRRRLIICVCNHLVYPRNEIHLRDFNKPTLHHETRDDEQYRSKHQRKVIGDEVCRVPVPPEEDGKAAKEEDYGDRDHAVPCRVGLKRGPEWEEAFVKALGLPTSSEPEIGLSKTHR